MNRRDFMCLAGFASTAFLSGCASWSCAASKRKPNIVFVFADQWRAQATGYAGDPNARTPVLDALEKQSIHFTNAVSGCPVCSPYRASLLTGQYPLTHGVFLNDVPLSNKAVSIAQACNAAGYDTAYIGKWHLEGNGRTNYIPPHRRQGFDFWQALECTHDYNHSFYYGGDDPARQVWPEYDAIAQTKSACRYIREHIQNPFVLFLSWGPPHAPYLTAPQEYRRRFRAEDIVLRPNVPQDQSAVARRDLAGYYAHIAVLDDCLNILLETIEQAGIGNDTIFVFTSDHGDMLYSQGMTKKQRPFEESACVPFLLRYPAVHGHLGRRIDMPINTPDIMPTLLGLAGVAIPETVQGQDFSTVIRGKQKPSKEAVLLTCPSPFGQWERRHGGREYRGIRTRRYTYTRDLNGPWLLYDNQTDPYQQKNLVDKPEFTDLQKELDSVLQHKLKEIHDDFRPGRDYIQQWGWTVDENGTVPYWVKNQEQANP
ncbi:MAG: sulfatase [Sedimentisphaerales bacterium]|nr:sulfatase [Sedimentisphaerales bacterium]